MCNEESEKLICPFCSKVIYSEDTGWKKKCKHYVTLSPVGSVSSHQIIKHKVAGDLICGWYDRNWIFNKYRLIGAMERHITVNGDEQFYIN